MFAVVLGAGCRSGENGALEVDDGAIIKGKDFPKQTYLTTGQTLV